MIQIAIVDDEQKEINTLSRYVSDYFKKLNRDDYKVSATNDAMNFIEHYKPIYNLIFLDVEMPLIDGFSVAKKIRQVDEETPIIFVTRMAQLAIKGYEVKAYDYVVKPVTYSDFFIRFDNVLPQIEKKKDPFIMVKTSEGFQKIAIGDIRYVEVFGHKCSYHLKDEVLECYGSLAELLKTLGPFDFMQCHRSYLVNTVFVRQIKEFEVDVDKDTLPISRPRKTEFLQ